MLDEQNELELYTFDVDDASAFPETIVMFKPLGSSWDNLACASRALEIVARECLFGGGATQEQAAKNAPKAIKMLEWWCGFSGEGAKAPNAPGLTVRKGWARSYISALCKKFGKPEKTEKKLLAAWDGHDWDGGKSHYKGYKAGIFDRLGSQSDNSNEISFQLVVAHALRKGPLRRFCVVGKLDPAEACKQWKQQKKEQGKEPLGKVDKRSAPTIIAVTAMLLLALRQVGHVSRTGFAPLNLRELTCWLRGVGGKEFVRSDLQKWFYNSKPLLMQASEQSGVKGWMISQEWLDDGEWQLIDITDGRESLGKFCEDHAGEGFRCYMDACDEKPDFVTGEYHVVGDNKTLAWFACDDYGR